jgi:flagellar hook-basal body complex protein FliE
MTTIPALRTAQALASYQGIDSLQPGATAEPAAAAGNFATLLGQSLNNAIATGQAAESQALSAVNGGGDLTQVVTAVSRAELTLQTTVALRDRVLQAYQDIIKMPI